MGHILIMSESTHTDSFLPVMSAIAREAGALLLPYFHRGLKIEYKGDADLVTAADRASEVLIRERIRQQFPSHDVLGRSRGSAIRAVTIDGMSIRLMVRPTLRMDIPCSACRWRWSIGGKIRHAALQEWCTTPRAMSCSRPR